MQLRWQRCLLFLLLAALCFLSNGLAGSFRLDVALDPVAPKEAGPTIIVTLQNRCNCSVSLPITESSDFVFTLRELSGRPVPLRMSDTLLLRGGYFRTLRPTAKLQYRVSLGELYQLRSGETYVVSAAYKYAPGFKHFGIPVFGSNEIQFQCK